MVLVRLYSLDISNTSLTDTGFVGGWIVQHLLMRGENPDAIRIIDMVPSTRASVLGKIDYVKADVTDTTTVETAFKKPWPGSTASLPLTVFHCVAYISSRDRNRDMVGIYVKVNIKGTENVLKAAQEAGATCFIYTSSGSVALRPPSFFPYPWQRWPKDIYQFLPNAEPLPYDTSLEECAACYSWSKMKAEELVLKANSPNFSTGAIRPSHAIYGHGIASSSNLAWDYLRRGGVPTWVPNVPSNFANAQNVSIGHLAYEDALLTQAHPGGKGYCVTDPNPPFRYGDFYRFLATAAHPSTPLNFPHVPHVVMLLLSYVVEQYILLRHRRLHWLPAVPEDLTYVQPGLFQVATLHIIYTDTLAQEEINYKAPIKSSEGLALAVIEWNDNVDKRQEFDRSKSEAEQ